MSGCMIFKTGDQGEGLGDLGGTQALMQGSPPSWMFKGYCGMCGVGDYFLMLYFLSCPLNLPGPRHPISWWTSHAPAPKADGGGAPLSNCSHHQVHMWWGGLQTIRNVGASIPRCQWWTAGDWAVGDVFICLLVGKHKALPYS